jgi:hypothetical protein
VVVVVVAAVAPLCLGGGFGGGVLPFVDICCFTS